MEDAFVPVDPFLTAAGDLACLVQQLGEGKAQPVAKPAGLQLSTYHFSPAEISLDLAVNISVGGIFSGSLDYSDHAFVLDAMLTADVTVPDDGTRLIVGTRYGTGLRILFRVSNVKSDVNLQWSVIGAAAQLGYLDASYQMLVYGLDAAPALSMLLDQFGKAGSLDAQTFASLQKSLQTEVSKQLLANRATLSATALPIAVLFSRPVASNRVDVAQSVLYAVRQIGRGLSLTQALNQGTSFSAAAVKTVWSEMVGDVQPGDAPSDDARRRAADWLKVIP